MAISPISSHACTRRGDKIRAVLTVVEAWSRVVFCHKSRRGSNSAVAPVVACVVLTFTRFLWIWNWMRSHQSPHTIERCHIVNTCIQHVLLTALAATPGSSPTQSRPTRGTRWSLRRRPAPGSGVRPTRPHGATQSALVNYATPVPGLGGGPVCVHTHMRRSRFAKIPNNFSNRPGKGFHSGPTAKLKHVPTRTCRHD